MNLNGQTRTHGTTIINVLLSSFHVIPFDQSELDWLIDRAMVIGMLLEVVVSLKLHHHGVLTQ